MHRHRFGADDTVGHAIAAPGVLDFLLDAKGPGRHGAEVVRFGFEDVFVGRVLKAAEDDWGAVFRELAHFLHLHVMQRVLCADIGGSNEQAGGVQVGETDGHAGPGEEGTAFAEVGGAARGVVNEVVGAGGDGEGVGCCDGAREGLDEG